MARPRIPFKKGQVYGSLTTLKTAGVDRRQNSLWQCRCACGHNTTVRASDLKRGAVRQCEWCGAVSGGAVQRKYKNTLPDATTKDTVVYAAWVSMRRTATDLPVPFEPDWEDFSAFYADVGERPEGDEQLVLGRIDSTLGFVRGNVEWQLMTERQRHKLNSLWWYVDGVQYPSASAAADAYGVSRKTISNWCQGPPNRKTGKRGDPKPGCWCEPQYPEYEPP